jgi:hypothetical protein
MAAAGFCSLGTEPVPSYGLLVRRPDTACVLAAVVVGVVTSLACSRGPTSAAPCYPSDRPDAACAPYPVLTQDDLPDCKVALTPDNIACAKKLFAPLLGPPWPFDANLVAQASGPMHGGCATYVAADWQLTVEHALSAACPWPAEYTYATDGVPFDVGPGCGPFIMAGGHPRTATCRQDGLWDCWESVPLEGVFDTCIRKADATSSWWLPLAPATPQVGDQVFVVGRPGFNWPTAELARQYQLPLVSAGKVIDIQGRALIMSAAVFAGDSGGAVLNPQGEIVGVLSSIVHDVREVGIVALPESLPDYYSISTRIDDPTRDVVGLVLGTGAE